MLFAEMVIYVDCPNEAKRNITKWSSVKLSEVKQSRLQQSIVK